MFQQKQQQTEHSTGKQAYQYPDLIWKEHQLFTSKDEERFTALWAHVCLKDVATWAPESPNFFRMGLFYKSEHTEAQWFPNLAADPSKESQDESEELADD